MPARLHVLYDGDCPYCAREIAHYMGLDRSNSIDWHNIATSSEFMTSHNISWNKAMTKLHVLDQDGRQFIGVNGFIQIWSNIDRYRVLAKIASCTPVRQILSLLYDKFAVWRFNRRCDSKTSCPKPS